MIALLTPPATVPPVAEIPGFAFVKIVPLNSSVMFCGTVIVPEVQVEVPPARPRAYTVPKTPAPISAIAELIHAQASAPGQLAVLAKSTMRMRLIFLNVNVQ